MKELITDSKIRSIFSDFQNNVNDSGLSNSSRQFSDAIRDFSFSYERPILKFEISYFSQLSGTFFGNCTDWILGQKIEFQDGQWNKTFENEGIISDVYVTPFENISSIKLGEISPTVVFLLLTETDLKNTDLNDKILGLGSQFPYLIIISETSYTIDTSIKRDLLVNSLFLEHYDVANLPQKKFTELVGTPGYHNKLNVIVNYNILSAIESFDKVFGLMVEQEERNLTGKKAVSQQQATKYQSKGNTPISEVVNQLKSELTNQITGLEKGISDSFENYMRPLTGKLSILVEEIIASLPPLEETEKSKTMALSISADFEKHFFDQVFDALYNACQNHLITIRDGFKILEHDIAAIMAKNNINSATVNLRPLTDQQLTLILNSSVRLDKKYEGALPKQGIFEYFNELRKYQSLVYMVIGSFGLTIFTNIKVIMIPTTIVLLGFFIYKIYKSVQQEHVESHEREYEKAKESLRNETKRIGGEVFKQWMKIISEHLKSQLNQNLTVVENSMKELNAKRTTEVEEEKMRLQKQLQNLDNSDKKIANVLRMRETFKRNFERLKSDLRQTLLNSKVPV